MCRTILITIVKKNTKTGICPDVLQQVDDDTVSYTYREIQVSNKQEQKIDMHKLDESPDNYAE